MNPLFFVPLVVASVAAAASCDIRQSPPWKEIAVYSVNEETGTLLKSRAWTPESPDYLAYSIQHMENNNDTYREQFAKGFYAYKKEDDPVKPFSMVSLLPPPEVLQAIKAFPSKTEPLQVGELKDDAERYIPLRNDSYTPYWRRFDRVLGMVQAEGRIYFFPDKKEKAQRLCWDGEDMYQLCRVSCFPNKDGLLMAGAKVRKDGKRVSMYLDPSTGKSFPCNLVSNCSFEDGYGPLGNPVRIDGEMTGMKTGSRRSSVFNVTSSYGESWKGVRQVWRSCELGGDVVVTDGTAWCSRGDNAVLLYPEPWEDPTAGMSVTLESRGSPAPGEMDFLLTLKNTSGKPVKLEQGWGDVILRFSGDGHFTLNNLCEVDFEPSTPGWKPPATDCHDYRTKDFLPSQTLNPGESASARIWYSCPDWRIYPRGPHVFVKATFSTAGPVGTPGHGMYTSIPIKVPNPVPPPPR